MRLPNEKKGVSPKSNRGSIKKASFDFAGIKFDIENPTLIHLIGLSLMRWLIGLGLVLIPSIALYLLNVKQVVIEISKYVIGL